MAIDKIHFEVNAGPNRHPVSTRQLLDTLRRLSVVFDYAFSVLTSATCSSVWIVQILLSAISF